MKKAILAIAIVASASGCAAIGKKWQSLIRGGPSEAEVAKAKAPQTTYSQQENLSPTTDRRYKRTTKRSFENDAHLQARAGSLWVMEGQGAYLFSENTVRMIGDPLAVRLEGDPKEQLAAKAEVIASLLKQLEDRRKRATQKPAPGQKLADGKTAEAGKDAAAAPAAPTGPEAEQRSPADASKNLNVKVIPTRVVERMVDGNYKVKGSQPMLIGGREYKVLVAGIVRAEDFNEQGVDASQLLDPSFDIVSARGAELRQ